MGRVSAGRVLAHRRIGADDSEINLSRTTYDLAERTVSMLDAMDEESTMAYSFPSGGGEITTTTQPDGSTQINQTWSGGQTKEVSGTAVAPMKFTSGVWSSGQWEKEIRIGTGASETEWVQTFSDIADRTVRVEYLDGAFAIMTYNALGQMETQVDPDGLVTEFEYDARGRTTARITAPGTADERRTEMAYEVASAHSTVVERTTTRVFNGSTAVVVGIDERGTDGRSQWSTRAGQLNSSIATTQSSGDWGVTNTAPNSAQTVQTFEDGMLV